MLKTPQAPTSDALVAVRAFADSLAEGLLGPEDVGVLYLAISFAEAHIRAGASSGCDSCQNACQGASPETAGGVLADDRDRRAA